MCALKRTLLASGLLSLCVATFAQPPEERDRPRDDEDRRNTEARERDREEDRDRESFVDRLMARDKNDDGKLSKEELLDERLARLFDRADKNDDGVVTAEELFALERSENEEYGRGERRPGDFGPREGGPPREGDRPRDGERDRGPRDGEDRPRGFGPPGGSDGPRGFGRPDAARFRMMNRNMMGPGMILPPPLVEELDLSQEQREELRELQQEVRERLQNILTEEQRDKLREIRERGPAGFGPGGPRRDGDRPADRPRDDDEQDRPRPERDRD